MDITGRAGLFLAGKVSPELQGVEISITERGAATPLITVATNEMGAYRYESPALYMTDKNKVPKNTMEDVTERQHKELKPALKSHVKGKRVKIFTSH